MWLILSQALIAGAACCSSGATFPSILGFSDRLQLGTTLTGSSSVGASNSQGDSFFFNNEEADRSLLHSVYGSFRLGDSWQGGATVNWFTRQKESYDTSESSTGLADTSLYLGYEFDSHLILSITQVIPTAENSFESTRPLRTDAMGRGLWTTSATLMWRDTRGLWDHHLAGALRYGWANRFDRPQTGEVSVDSVWGASAIVGGGYQWPFKRIRSGLGVGLQWDQGLTERDRFQVRSSSYKMVWDLVADLSLPLLDFGNFSIAYKDQTLLGPTQNADLSRSVSVAFSRAWSL